MFPAESSQKNPRLPFRHHLLPRFSSSSVTPPCIEVMQLAMHSKPRFAFAHTRCLIHVFRPPRPRWRKNNKVAPAKDVMPASSSKQVTSSPRLNPIRPARRPPPSTLPGIRPRILSGSSDTAGLEAPKKLDFSSLPALKGPRPNLPVGLPPLDTSPATPRRDTPSRLFNAKSTASSRKNSINSLGKMTG